MCSKLNQTIDPTSKHLRAALGLSSRSSALPCLTSSAACCALPPGLHSLLASASCNHYSLGTSNWATFPKYAAKSIRNRQKCLLAAGAGHGAPQKSL